MAITKRIGIVGGNGWLGSAIASALVASGTIDADALILSGRSAERPGRVIPGAHRTTDNAELVKRSDVIVLSVGPEQFPAVDIQARGKLVVSVMARVSAQVIAQRTGAEQIVRAMPNAAASLRKSFTPWFAKSAVSDENRTLVQTLFEACGEADEVLREEHIDDCVGLTGSGAAFPALLAQSMVDHAVAHGLPMAFARRAARSVLTNASQLLAAADDPGAIVEAMIDYRGTTAAALLAMIDHGFKTSVGAGLDAAAAAARNPV